MNLIMTWFARIITKIVYIVYNVNIAADAVQSPRPHTSEWCEGMC